MRSSVTQPGWFLRRAAALLATVTVPAALLGQEPRRYESEVFPSYDLKSTITYGQAVKASGSPMTLTLDVYTPPATDTATNRPLVIFIHGGGFKDGDKVSNFGTLVCGGLARRGYVVASINYRLGSSSNLTSDSAYFEALYRGVQDGRAAVRFFRRYAATYGVDPRQVFVTGSSAGSKIALHMAFLEQREVPAFVDTTRMGSLEGSSGNPGYPSGVQGVIANWGALWDYRWINAGDVPVFCVHGMTDDTVPYDSSFSYHGFTYGSSIIYQRGREVQVAAGLLLFPATGHTLDNNTAKQDSALRTFSRWLAGLLPQLQTSVEQPGTGRPVGSHRLGQNYPNPFNPISTIEYSVAASGDRPATAPGETMGASRLRLVVYDLLGREVSVLVDGSRTPGHHTATFDGTRLASGVYVCRLSTDGFLASRTMVLSK